MVADELIDENPKENNYESHFLKERSSISMLFSFQVMNKVKHPGVIGTI